jgi:hypothetical protein
LSGNGSETLYPHGGKRFTVSGVGLIELVVDEEGNETVITLEPLGPQQQERLDMWLEERKREPRL